MNTGGGGKASRVFICRRRTKNGEVSLLILMGNTDKDAGSRPQSRHCSARADQTKRRRSARCVPYPSCVCTLYNSWAQTLLPRRWDNRRETQHACCGPKGVIIRKATFSRGQARAYQGIPVTQSCIPRPACRSVRHAQLAQIDCSASRPTSTESTPHPIRLVFLFPFFSFPTCPANMTVSSRVA